MRSTPAAEVRAKLEQALRLLEEVCQADYWGYTKEFGLGKVDAAKSLVQAVLESEFGSKEA